MSLGISPLKRGALVAALLLPAASWAAAPGQTFEAQQQAYAQAWGAPSAHCADPVPAAGVANEEDERDLKSALRLYQACLKPGVADLEARQSAEPLVGAARWAAFTATQRESLQQTLADANRQAIRELVDQGQGVAARARVDLAAFQNVRRREKEAKEEAAAIDLIRSCGPRYERIEQRAAELGDEYAAMQSEQQHIDALMFSLNLQKYAQKTPAYYSQLNEYNSRVSSISRRGKQYNNRINDLNEDRKSVESDCGDVSVPRGALDKACNDPGTRRYCARFQR